MFDLMFGWRKASQCKKLMKKLRCRLSLLKNKRCCIVKQLRNDVAQLIKHGHHQTAFHRVDEIYKDECIIAVYDLLAHFCEFLSHQLPYIRRSRDCPNDINEAISSIIFASARCGELPELLRIRKLFSQRYGERFEARALDLLPGNLVNFQVIDI
ncbi:putative vacuolar protein sorting-associated protein Ist1 [Helianthus annuus]|nr:putative vacuolar protein sorting-associated protein Ist1 [Helianthus annuus]